MLRIAALTALLALSACGDWLHQPATIPGSVQRPFGAGSANSTYQPPGSLNR